MSEELDLQKLHVQAQGEILKALILGARRPTGGSDVLAYAQAFVTLNRATLPGELPEAPEPPAFDDL